MRNGCLCALLMLGGSSLASGQGYPGYAPAYYPSPGYPAWHAAAPYGAAYRPAAPYPWSAYPPGAMPAYPVAPGPRGALPVYYRGQAPATPPLAGPDPVTPTNVQRPLPPGYPQGKSARPPQSAAQAGPPQQPVAAPDAGPSPEPIAPPEDSPPAGDPDSPREPVLSPLAPGGVESACPPAPPLPPAGSGLWDADEAPVPEPPRDHEGEPPDHGPPGYKYYGSADWLVWWVKQRSSPPLLTTGPLGAPGTKVLVDGDSFDEQQRLGARLTLGTWLTQRQNIGLEATGLWLAERNFAFLAGGPVLARPFANAVTGAESAVVLAAPGAQTGAAAVRVMDRLWGGEANLRLEIYRCSWGHLDVLGGFRYLQLEDALDSNDRTTFGPGVAGLAGSTVFAADSFGARNRFYGGQLGLQGEFHRGRYYLNLWGKLALGCIQQEVDIAGNTVLVSPGGVRTPLPGGLLALRSNSGSFDCSEFSFIPEVGVNVGVKLSPHLRLAGGYTFLYVYNVVRSGDQIDRAINTAQRPALDGAPVPFGGPPRPAFAFQDTSFWTQGLNVSLEFRY